MEDNKDYETDGEMYAEMHKAEQAARDRRMVETRNQLDERGIKYQAISGGYIISSPANYNRFYYYPSSDKWRQEGKSKYYRCKGIIDLLDRFIVKV